MATKPTILKTPNSSGSSGAPSPEKSAAPAPPPASGSGGGRLRWILIGAVALVLLGAIGVGGRLYLRKHAHGATSAAKTPKKAEKPATPAPPTTVEMPMEPFVVNLADPGGHSYARVGLSLSLIAPAAAPKSDGGGEGGAAAQSADDSSALRDLARDTIITVISQQQSADLLAPGGKDHLKELLKQALTARDPRLKVADIYITEFLVQA